MSEPKPNARLEAEASSDYEAPTPKRRKTSSFPVAAQSALLGQIPGSHDYDLEPEGSSTTTAIEQSLPTESEPEMKTPIDTWTIPSGPSEPARVPMADSNVASRDESTQTTWKSTATLSNTRHRAILARRRIDNNTTARSFRPVYRRTGVTLTDNDLTIHRAPAIPELNYCGNRDAVYQGIEATKATGFTTLRLGSEKYRELFDRTDSMTRTGVMEPQRNRPFVTLKYGKGKVIHSGSG